MGKERGLNGTFDMEKLGKPRDLTIKLCKWDEQETWVPTAQATVKIKGGRRGKLRGTRKNGHSMGKKPGRERSGVAEMEKSLKASASGDGRWGKNRGGFLGENVTISRREEGADQSSTSRKMIKKGESFQADASPEIGKGHHYFAREKNWVVPMGSVREGG